MSKMLKLLVLGAITAGTFSACDVIGKRQESTMKDLDENKISQLQIKNNKTQAEALNGSKLTASNLAYETRFTHPSLDAKDYILAKDMNLKSVATGKPAKSDSKDENVFDEMDRGAMFFDLGGKITGYLERIEPTTENLEKISASTGIPVDALPYSEPKSEEMNAKLIDENPDCEGNIETFSAYGPLDVDISQTDLSFLVMPESKRDEIKNNTLTKEDVKPRPFSLLDKNQQQSVFTSFKPEIGKFHVLNFLFGKACVVGTKVSALVSTYDGYKPVASDQIVADADKIMIRDIRTIPSSELSKYKLSSGITLKDLAFVADEKLDQEVPVFTQGEYKMTEYFAFLRKNRSSSGVVNPLDTQTTNTTTTSSATTSTATMADLVDIPTLINQANHQALADTSGWVDQDPSSPIEAAKPSITVAQNGAPALTKDVFEKMATDTAVDDSWYKKNWFNPSMLRSSYYNYQITSSKKILYTTYGDRYSKYWDNSKFYSNGNSDGGKDAVCAKYDYKTTVNFNASLQTPTQINDNPFYTLSFNNGAVTKPVTYVPVLLDQFLSMADDPDGIGVADALNSMVNGILKPPPGAKTQNYVIDICYKTNGEFQAYWKSTESSATGYTVDNVKDFTMAYDSDSKTMKSTTNDYTNGTVAYTGKHTNPWYASQTTEAKVPSALNLFPNRTTGAPHSDIHFVSKNNKQYLVFHLTFRRAIPFDKLFSYVNKKELYGLAGWDRQGVIDAFYASSQKGEKLRSEIVVFGGVNQTDNKVMTAADLKKEQIIDYDDKMIEYPIYTQLPGEASEATLPATFVK